MKSLTQKYGQWALVTGASEGIGKAFAQQLAGYGFNLVLVARRKELLEKLALELEEGFSISTHVLAADLSTAQGTETILNETQSINIGLYIASAGFGTSGDFMSIPIENEIDMLNVNCRSVVTHCHAFAKRFCERGSGGIILLSSIVAFQGTPRSAHYAATKSYIQTLAEGLNVELSQYDIDVLAVSPGPVDSGFSKAADMMLKHSDKPEAVAEQALKSLGRTNSCKPGFWGKLLGYSLSLTPRQLRIKIMAQVMKSMTMHQSREKLASENT